MQKYKKLSLETFWWKSRLMTTSILIHQKGNLMITTHTLNEWKLTLFLHLTNENSSIFLGF